MSNPPGKSIFSSRIEFCDIWDYWQSDEHIVPDQLINWWEVRKLNQKLILRTILSTIKRRPFTLVTSPSPKTTYHTTRTTNIPKRSRAAWKRETSQLKTVRMTKFAVLTPSLRYSSSKSKAILQIEFIVSIDPEY